MITKLTDAQEKLLIQRRQEWLEYGRSCEPADREMAS